MDSFKHHITKLKLNEAAYPNNIGFEEMVLFYQKADSSQIKKMEKAIKNDDWDSFKNLIKSVINIKLK